METILSNTIEGRGLGAALLDSARRHADRPALWAAKEELSYRELFERAGAVAAALRAVGIAAGERVAILSRRSSTLYLAVLGALMAGCTYVPLNTRFPRDRNVAIMRASGASALIADHYCASRIADFLDPLAAAVPIVLPELANGDTDNIGNVDNTGSRRIAVPKAGELRLEQIEATAPLDGDQPCYLLFTSGTTGKPKGVPISHANLAAYLPAVHALVPIDATDRVLQCVDLTFDLSVHDMFLTWLNGAALFITPENGSIFAPRLIAAHALTASLLVPSTGARALEQGLLGAGSMPTLRYSLFAGEALPVSMVEVWQQAAPNSTIYNLYGPTEGTIHVSCYRLEANTELTMPIVPIGHPIGAQRMELFESGVRVAPGETGEIYLAGPQMTRGYWRAPDLDAEKFVTMEGVRWYRTGDVGRYVEPFGIVFGGRVDRQVKIRGYRVELQEIEGVLRRLTGREQVAVLAWPLTAEGIAEGCVAFIAGDGMNAIALREGCRASLPPYMVPNSIFFVDELPLNANGKTDYRSLSRNPLLELPSSSGEKSRDD